MTEKFSNINIAENQDKFLSGKNEQLLKFTVVGLIVTPEFQKCKYIVERLHRCYPENYPEPVIKPMLDLEWNEFLRNERRLKGGDLWSLTSGVAVYFNEEYMGETVLCKYLSSRYILPMKNFYEMGKEALSNHLTDVMSNGRRCVYFMVSIGGFIVGTMIFTLFEDMVPKTCRLFLKRCKNLKNGYSNTPIQRVVESSWIQCGGDKLEESKMPCENFSISHDKRGIISMCNSGRHKNNTTQFFVTLQKSTWMDGHYVAFGQLLQGDWVLSQIEAVPTKYQSPLKEVKIVKAGEFDLAIPKLTDSRQIRDLNEFLDERMAKKDFQNYCDDPDSRKKSGDIEILKSDLRSYFPMEMLPRSIQEAFNYLPGKKSSCVFETENCSRCGCSHDLGNCLKKVYGIPSEQSFDY